MKTWGAQQIDATTGNPLLFMACARAVTWRHRGDRPATGKFVTSQLPRFLRRPHTASPTLACRSACWTSASRRPRGPR